MKIAVLFGSFNPMTNAHLAAMKTVVNHLQADLGLFVATNDKYLLKKTVKKNDPFRLSESQRKEIIEKTCVGEEKLSFFGFELGGAVPNRYNTLKKIMRQYPGAEIYEIQGADKLRSIPKFSNAEEYLSNIRFALLERDDIDLQATIEQDPILTKHKDAFTILPALDDLTEISSTMVRQRFYNGEDFSDLVPAVAVEILSRYTPADFVHTWEDRIKAKLWDGRFGGGAARRMVYQENRNLFLRWKEGAAEVDLGDLQQYVDDTKLYSAPYDVTELGDRYPTTETGCINIDCMDLAEHLLHKGYKPAILNLASGIRAGGGYAKGTLAQEEALCYGSTLSLSLYQYGGLRDKGVKENIMPHKGEGYPLDLNYGGIYTPNVTFFRHNQSKFYTLRKNPFRCDVISVAALSFNGNHQYSNVNELAYRAEDGGFTPEGAKIMRNKIRTIYRMAISHGRDSLILGAFGCGVYQLSCEAVSALFRDVMNEPEFAGKFRLVTFAILEGSKGPRGENGKFAPYYQQFGTYTLD